MTTCPSCGTSVPDDAQFCLECGRSITRAAQAPAEPASYASYSSDSAATAVYPPAAVTSPTYQPQGRNIYRLLSLVLGVLLVGVTVILIIMLVRVSGSSAIKSGMTPTQTIEALNTTGRNLYDKLASNNISEGDLLTAYSTLQDVIPKAAKEEFLRRMKMEVDRSGGLPTFKVVEEKIIDSDHATVRISVQEMRPDGTPRESTSPPIPMIKEDGKWKFDVMRLMGPMMF